jgi:transcriptional regulator with XRE-family HTH domain
VLVTISQRLKQARRRLGWRQTDLAQAAKVGIATIRRIEQEAMEPRLATARRIADALGIRVEWLVFGSGAITDERSEDGSS